MKTSVMWIKLELTLSPQRDNNFPKMLAMGNEMVEQSPPTVGAQAKNSLTQSMGTMKKNIQFQYVLQGMKH